ncbi:hypothetical protein [Silvibacterium acidisoli]|uniref:hypothetical protein n=1 Tax=Acidobacteriaceae bacterium ZG23-2 TaxID=2883246 RepID=UPI00406C9CC0
MATATARSIARDYLSDSYLFEWDKRSFRADLIFVLPVALCLVIGFAAGHPGAALISAAAP